MVTRVVFVIVLIAFANGATLYLSEDGTDTTSCSSSSPCGTLQDVVQVFNSNYANDTELFIEVAQGVYSGSGNSNIEFPNVPITMEASDPEKFSTFTCNGGRDFLFSIVNDITLNNMYLSDCYSGIYITGGNTEITNVGFLNMEICLSADYSESFNFQKVKCFFNKI